MADETELKLELTKAGAGLVEKSSLLPGNSSRVKQVSTYYDTPDRLLGKAGFSLRIRQSNGARVQTIKGDGSKAAGLFVRSEWERGVEDDRPVLDDSTPVRALIGEKLREIAPVFEVYVTRRTWMVEDGETRIEVVLDRGEVVAQDRRTPICEVELELKAGDSAALFSMARRIDAIAPVRLGVMSKAERGDRLCREIVASVKSAPVALHDEVTTEAAFQKIAGASLRQFRLNEGSISRQNPDALHQARVGLRRLRSAMTIFKPILTDEDFSLIRDNLRWLTGELGKARNLDVLAVRAESELLRGRFEAARNDAYTGVAAALDSSRARALMINLAEWIAHGRWLSRQEKQDERNRAAHGFARNALDRLRKKVKKAGSLATLDDARRHEVRKNVKKLRYASEFFASLFDDKRGRRRHKRFFGALERLQDELGRLNDIATLSSVLEELGLEDSPEAQLIVPAGEKADLLDAAAEALDDLAEAKRFWA